VSLSTPDRILKTGTSRDGVGRRHQKAKVKNKNARGPHNPHKNCVLKKTERKLI